MFVSNGNASGCGCDCSSGMGCVCGCSGMGDFTSFVSSLQTMSGTSWVLLGGAVVLGATLIDYLFRGRPRRR